jgi:enterochelin esterase-like enzyme
VAAAERRPLRFVLDAGRLETWVPRSEAPSLLTANRHLRTVLQAKGYPVRYAEAAGGHAFFSWQLTLAEGLMSLLGSG